MTATTCAWCSTRASMLFRATQERVPGVPGAELWQAVFACSHCGRLSIGELRLDAGHSSPHAKGGDYWNERADRIRWVPESVGGREFADVPAAIAGAADEAYRCRSIGALRAAILLARSVVEATAKEKGIVKGTLAEKIDALSAAGFVREFTREAAHEIRHLGNDMAHGDFVDPPDTEDCDAVLDVMSEILNEVYQGPARVGRMKSKREVSE